MVYCVRRYLAWLQRHVKHFLIVFIFTSGVGNGLLKPVHRLCSVSAETVSNAPNTSSAETTRRKLSASDNHIEQETYGERLRRLSAMNSPDASVIKKGDTIENKTKLVAETKSQAVSLGSDDDAEVSLETDRTEISGEKTQSEIVVKGTPTKLALSSEAETKKTKDDALRYETRQTLLKNVEETWAVQNNHNVPVATETVSPKIPLPQPKTLQQYAKRIILPQIHIERMPLSETLKIISDVIKTHTTNER